MEEIRVAAKKLLWYLDLVDGNRYVVTISQQDAERLGVSKESYECIITELNDVNRLTLIELEKEKSIPGYKVIICSPDELIAANIPDSPMAREG